MITREATLEEVKIGQVIQHALGQKTWPQANPNEQFPEERVMTYVVLAKKIYHTKVFSKIGEITTINGFKVNVLDNDILFVLE
jgi:hypothetical protein